MSRLYPCVYCTEDGYCKKFSDEEVVSWCVMSPCKDEKPSNADRIRSMTDEELAVKLAGNACPPNHKNPITECEVTGHPCYECWLDWLKQEVSE